MGVARPLEATRPADAEERARALDATQSFLVDAPAGSGKTELLIQRYLKLLALVEAPEAVVAITFTVKAASEMRTRVVEALGRAAGEARPEAAHEALTWDLAAAVLERDRERRWDLRDHPARMRIQTIDALCGSITRQMPWLSRFGSQPQVTEQAEDLYREAARNLVARLPEPLVVLLERLDNQVPAMTDLLVGMLARRDQWLRHVMRSTAREELEGALRAVIQEELATVCACVPAEWAGEMVKLARFAAANLRDGGRVSDLAACHGLAGLPGTASEDLAAWKGLATLLLKTDGEWRSKADVRTGFPADQKQTKRRFEEMLGALREGHEALREALAGLKWLPDASYDEAQWRAMEALFELLPVAVAELQLVFADRGVVDFTEIGLRASWALGSDERPTNLALSLDYRIQHLLVDEFQDTSLSQYRLLRQLTAGWERRDGRTLFLVGDPMQSIYRFREAEVGLFLRARREGIGTVALEPLRLTVNFRSQAGIVDWVNSAFAAVFPAREEISTGAVTYSPSVAHREGEDAAVEVHPFFRRDAAAEAALVLELVRAARAADPQGKTAILARARTHLPRILRALEGAGLRYRAIEIDELSARPLIQDLLALTRALVHAGDRTAWLAVLRAPWCGLTLADLDALAGGNPYAAVWDLMTDESRLSAEGRARLRRVRGVLGESLQLSRRVPLRNWVESTWVRLGGPACLGSATDWEDAQGFFQLLDGVEEGGEAPDPHVLAARVERLFAAPDLEADESLQVLTIHKAKGLEFDTVIVPGLGRTPPADDARLLAWLETTTSEGEALLLLAPVKATGGESDQTGRYLRRVERKKEEHEAVRLLYVAATRARRRLHLLGDVPLKAKDGVEAPGHPEAGSLLARLWPVVEGEFAAAFAARGAAPALAQEAGARETRIRRLPAGWALPEAAASVTWKRQMAEQIDEDAEAEWADETRRHVGTVVHRMLRRIAEEGLERWDAGAVAAQRVLVRAALAGLGVPPDEMEGAVAEVERALSASVANARGRWILERGHTGARSEYPVTGMVNGRLVAGVIDRTFVDETGTRWIIDFKTSSHEGEGLEAFLDQEQERYLAQLSEYAALFAALEERPIRMGLYFPLIGEWREWEYERGLGDGG